MVVRPRASMLRVIAQDYASLAQSSEGQAIQDVVLSFGPHKGKPIKQVDNEYLLWMQTLESSWWRKLASQVLEQRNRPQQVDTKNKKTKTEVRVLLAELKGTRKLERGRQIHAEAIESGDDSCIYVATALLNMYAKCGSMVDARQVFDRMDEPDVVSWNALIMGYAKNGEGVTALDLFAKMRSQGIATDCITFVAALKACTSLVQQDGSGKAECLERGKQIHSKIGCCSDVYVENTLIDMYAKSGSMKDAHHVFDSIKNPTVVSWTALLLGYAENGEGSIALDLFAKMKCKGYVPNSVTYVAALKACASLALQQDGNGKADCLERGKKLHSEIVCFSDTNVQNTLIYMYASCGSMVDAHQVFNGMKNPDVVAWNTLMLGYAENGEGATSLDLFARMRSQGCTPDFVTYVAALKACISFSADASECLEQGKQIHSEIPNSHSYNCVQNTLIDMYANCGSMINARRVFDSMKHPDVVSWTALILGYAENGECVTALDLFARMKSQGSCVPNCITFVAALKACSLLGALESGSKIHAEMDAGTEDGILVTCLVDFYAKCGNLVKAQKVFDSHPRTRGLRTWTALLTGYSCVGESKAVFELFEGMQDAGFKPSNVTFLCILTCCNHAGLVEKASEFFEAMSTKYGICPTVEHYSCMVDILGRSNKLDDAVALFRGMPWRPDTVIWITVLAACRKWKNAGIGRLAFKSLVSLDDSYAPAYVLMAHIFGSRGMWEEQAMILGMRKKCLNEFSVS